MKLLIIPVHVPSAGTNTSLCTPKSNTHGMHTVPHPYKTTSKMTHLTLYSLWGT